MKLWTNVCLTLALYASVVMDLGANAVDAALSISRGSDPDQVRDAQVKTQSLAIVNVARNLTLGNETLPFFVGPIPTPGSLAEKLRQSEAYQFTSASNPRPAFVATVAASQLSTLQSFTDIEGMYRNMTPLMVMPMAMDNSDASFGRQRLTIKAMKLRRVSLLEPLSPEHRV